MAYDPLPENVEDTYDDGGDELTRLHQEHHDRVHEQVNRVGADNFPDATGQPADQVPTTDGDDGYNFTTKASDPHGNEAHSATFATTAQLEAPWAKITNSVAQTIATSTVTQLEFDTAVENPSAMADLTNNRITAQEPGIYLASIAVRFSPSSGTRIQLRVRLGANTRTLQDWNAGGFTQTFATFIVMQLATGDHVTADAYHEEGVDLDTSPSTGLQVPGLTVAKIGDVPS